MNKLWLYVVIFILSNAIGITMLVNIAGRHQ